MTQKVHEASASISDVRSALEVVKGFGQMALGASGVDLNESDLSSLQGAVDDVLHAGTTVEIWIARGDERRKLVRFEITADPA